MFYTLYVWDAILETKIHETRDAGPKKEVGGDEVGTPDTQLYETSTETLGNMNNCEEYEYFIASISPSSINIQQIKNICWASSSVITIDHFILTGQIKSGGSKYSAVYTLIKDQLCSMIVSRNWYQSHPQVC